jgi:hypothetical protein
MRFFAPLRMTNEGLRITDKEHGFEHLKIWILRLFRISIFGFRISKGREQQHGINAG